MKSTPRRFFAVLYKLNEINNYLYAKPEQEVLIGKDAVKALSALANQLR